MRLSDTKIEDINNKLLASVNSQLYDAKKGIDEGEAKLAEAGEPAKQPEKCARAETAGNKRSAWSGKLWLNAGDFWENQRDHFAAGGNRRPEGRRPQRHKPSGSGANRATCAEGASGSGELEAYQKQLAEVQSGSITAATQFGSAGAQLASAQQTIDSNKQQLADARSQYESSREEALSKANVDALVDKRNTRGNYQGSRFFDAGWLS